MSGCGGSKAGQLVQILPPEVLLCGQRRYQHLRRILCMGGKELQHGRLVPHRVCLTAALTLGIEGAQSGKGEGQSHRQPPRPFQIGGDAGQHPCPPLGDGVQGDIQQPVIDVGIGKPLLHCTGKGFAVLTGQGKGGDDLLKQRPLQIAPDRLVLHAVTDDVVARQIRRQHHAGVATVQDADLLLLIGMVVRHELHRKSRLLGGKLPAQGLASLDDPEAEGLGGIQQSILIAVFSVEPGSLSGRISGDDAVHQCIAETVLLPEPA